MSNSKPVHITYGNFCRELEDLFSEGRISAQMFWCLQRLFASHGRSVQRPEANEYLKDLFERRLSGGILLSDDRRTVHYDIRIKNSRFRLVRRRKTEIHPYH